MDTDALLAARSADWHTLHTLAYRRRLSGQDIDMLARLYAACSADLGRVRTLGDADIVMSLSRDLQAARARLTTRVASPAQQLSRWFRMTLPVALYEIRWWSLTVMAVFLAIVAAQTAYILFNPELMSLLGRPSQLEEYATQSFEAYYHQDTNAQFGMSVWFNNAWIALQMVVTGVTVLYPLYLLVKNALSIGVAAAVVFTYASPAHFFSFILPHGFPELTAIFIACAAGLRVGWAWINPGSRPRSHALAGAGRTMMNVGLGLVILLFISGLIEGFVTPSSLPVAVKITLGFLVVVGVWTYTFVVGGRAARAGETGDIADPAVAGYYEQFAGE